MVFNTTRPVAPAEVVQLIQSGRNAEALAAGRQLLSVHPGNPQLYQLVAVAALQSGAHAEGIDLLRRANALKPHDAAITFNLCKALGDAGRIDEALAMARGPFAGQSDFQRLAAELSRRAGKHADAKTTYAGLLRSSPQDPELLNNYATACLATNDVDGALEALVRARALAPSMVPVLVNLAKAHGLAGNFDDAISAAQAARQLAPNDTVTALELGRALKLANRIEDAMTLLVAAFDKHRTSADLAIEIGLCFSALAEFDRAEESFRQAVKLAPTNAQAYLNLGTLLEQANQLDSLDELLAQASANALEGPEVGFLLAMALQRRGKLAEARACLERPDPEEAVNPAVRHHLLGQVADKMGDAPAAWEAFSAMNREAAQSQKGRDLKGHEYCDYIAELSQAVTPDWYASWPKLEPSPGPSPVFLVGFPRSGTTLLDTMLMGHPLLHVLEEEPVLASVHAQLGNIVDIPALGQAQVDGLRQAYFDGVEALGSVPAGSLIVDKLPLNLLRVPLILRLFPDARFILALRHPCDSVLSCFMQNFQVNRAMASFWSIEQTARTYDAAFSFWTKCRDFMPMNIATVRYEDLIASTETELARLAEFIGVTYHDAMADFRSTAKDRGRVRTPSYSQITEGVYQRARGRWERYQNQMAPALPLLAPWAERFGYGSLEPG